MGNVVVGARRAGSSVSQTAADLLGFSQPSLGKVSSERQENIVVMSGFRGHNGQIGWRPQRDNMNSNDHFGTTGV